jgi:hypothetical protein
MCPCASDRGEPGGKRRGRLAIDRRVGLTKQRAPLGMSDDHVLGARLANHRRADFARERALAIPVSILRGNDDVAVASGLGRRVESGKRRRNHDLDVGDVLHQGAELFDVLHGLGDRLVHLPVPGYEWCSHEQAFNDEGHEEYEVVVLSCSS